MNYQDPLILCCKFIAECARIICAAIVDQKQLQIREFLMKNAVHTAPQCRLRIVDRHDNTNLWIHFYSPTSRSHNAFHATLHFPMWSWQRPDR